MEIDTHAHTYTHPERGRCRKPTDPCWPGSWAVDSLHLGNNSDGSGSLWLVIIKDFNSKNGVDLSQWLGIAQWLILKVSTVKRENGGRLEWGVSLGLCHPNSNTVEKTDQQNCRACCLFIYWLVGSYWFIGITYVIHTNSLLIICAVNICFHSLCCHFFNSMLSGTEVSHFKVVLMKF